MDVNMNIVRQFLITLEWLPRTRGVKTQHRLIYTIPTTILQLHNLTWDFGRKHGTTGLISIHRIGRKMELDPQTPLVKEREKMNHQLDSLIKTMEYILTIITPSRFYI